MAVLQGIPEKKLKLSSVAKQPSTVERAKAQGIPEKSLTLPEEVNEYTFGEKALVKTVEYGLPIAGGILGVAGGIPGIIAGGAAGAAGGRIIADNLEEAFGGEEREAEEILKRAGTDAIVDAAFTVGTFGAGKALRVTGLDKPIKAAASKVFRPISNAVKKLAEPVYKSKAIQKTIEGIKKNITKLESTKLAKGKLGDIFKSAKQKRLDALRKQLSEIEQGTTSKLGTMKKEINTMLDDVTNKTVNASKLGLKTADDGLKQIQEEISNVLVRLEPQLDEGMRGAKQVLSDSWEDMVKLKGAKTPVAFDIDKLVKKLRAGNVGKEETDMVKRLFYKVVSQPDQKEIIEGVMAAYKFSAEEAIEFATKAGMIKPPAMVKKKVTLDMAHKAKLMVDNIINNKTSGSAVKRINLDQIITAKNNLVDDIDKAVGGGYRKLAKNYSRYFQVERNINEALGRVGSGATEELRGKSIRELMETSMKELTPEQLLEQQRGFVGKLNSQINLLSDIGLEDEAVRMSDDLLKLGKNLYKESDYKKIKSIFESLNKDLKLKDKLNISDLRKVQQLADIKTFGNKKNLNEILDIKRKLDALKIEQRVAKETGLTMTKAQKTLINETAAKYNKKINEIDRETRSIGRDVKGKRIAIDKELEKIQDLPKGFHSYTDRYMPQIFAVGAGQVMPKLRPQLYSIAAIYTLYRLKNFGGYAAVEAIKMVGENMTKIPFGYRVMAQKFVAAFVNDIRNSE